MFRESWAKASDNKRRTMPKTLPLFCLGLDGSFSEHYVTWSAALWAVLIKHHLDVIHLFKHCTLLTNQRTMLHHCQIDRRCIPLMEARCLNGVERAHRCLIIVLLTSLALHVWNASIARGLWPIWLPMQKTSQGSNLAKLLELIDRILCMCSHPEGFRF